MKQTQDYQTPLSLEIVTDYRGVLCVSGTGLNDLGGYWGDFKPTYGEDD